MISKHFFEHRYDYRAEWMRFTATLATGARCRDDDDRNLYRRVVKALAELTGSPAALLLLPGASGAFRVAEQWHWPAAIEEEEATLSLRSAFMLQETQHIVDLDAQRRGKRMTISRFPTGWLPTIVPGSSYRCCISSG